MLVERWHRRICSLPESRMRVVVATELIEATSDDDLVEVLHAALGRSARRERSYEVLLEACCEAFASPATVSYGRVASVYARARELGRDEVARLLLAPGAERTAGPGELTADPRLADVTLGHRKTWARTVDTDGINRFMRDTDPSVIKNLMLNPRLREADVVRLVARRPNAGPVLEVVYRSRWLRRYAVRKALVLNPYTPVEVSVKCVASLMEPDLRHAAGDGTLHGQVRAAARETLELRRPDEDKQPEPIAATAEPRATPPAEVLAAWGLSAAALRRVDGGLINRTFEVRTDGARFALQWVSPIFGVEVQDDIEAVTRQLAAHGLLTPRLVPTTGGRLWTEVEGEVWRLLTWIDGVTVQRVDSPERAREAAALLGRFHAALDGADIVLRGSRVGVHDTPKHLAALRASLAANAGHPRHAEAARIGGEILAAAAGLPSLAGLPERLVHGDPKISNVIFAADGRALCLVDLDTLARMSLAAELGDALRSWCNPAGEDATTTRFDVEVLAAALRGYAGTARFVTAAEARAIVAGVETITLELAARFCADALNERYFGWDPSRFGSRSEHNLVRAEGQWQLWRSLAGQRGLALSAVNAAF